MGLESPLGLSNHENNQEEQQEASASKNSGMKSKIKSLANAMMLTSALAATPGTAQAFESQDDVVPNTAEQSIEKGSIASDIEWANAVFPSMREDFSKIESMNSDKEKLDAAVDVLSHMSKVLNQFAVDKSDSGSEFSFDDGKGVTKKYSEALLNIFKEMRSMYSVAQEKYGVVYENETRIVHEIKDFDRAIDQLTDIVAK